MRKLFLVITILFISLSALGQDILPERAQGMVNDYANMLSSSEVNRLEQKLEIIEIPQRM